MSEAFFGGVASPFLCRLANNPLRDSYATPGYGLYFTEDRLMGVSYKKIVSRAYRPAWIAFLIWVGLLTLTIAYFVFTKATESIFLPFVMLFILVPLAFLVFLSPRRAAKLVREAQAKSILELAGQQQDLVVERRNISEVQVEGLQVRVLTRSGEWYFFAMYSRNYDSSVSRREIGLLLTLFQKFCTVDPPITMFTKSKKQWTALQP